MDFSYYSFVEKKKKKEPLRQEKFKKALWGRCYFYLGLDEWISRAQRFLRSLEILSLIWKRWVFIAIPKKGNANECSNYHTIALILHASVQTRFRKGRGTCQHLLDHRKSKRVPKKSISALLTMSKPLTVDHNKLWKILKEMGIPDHLNCLLRNLYAGQEVTVRTGHGTTDWFQIGKGVHQGCILSPCLFNLYAEYI